MDGRMKKLETKVLEPEDTVALMKSITPERCQQELQEVGGSRLRLCLRRLGPLPRVGLQAEGARGDGAAADSREVAELQRPGDAARCCKDLSAAARTGAGDRADGLGQDDHAGGDDRLPQRELSTTTSSRSRTRSSSITRTRSRRSTSGKSAWTCPVSPRRSAAPCGRTRT